MGAALIFSMTVSLDGYVADSSGSFEWAAPREDVHRFVNDVQRRVGTYLLGRRVYEVMQVWDRADFATGTAFLEDYATIWRAADKVVYSTTLTEVSTARTRIERSFDAAAVRELKATSARDIGIGGPGLAAHAWKAGLVDECHLFLVPVVVGGGVRALPDGVLAELELVALHRFTGGVLHLHYRPRRDAG